MVMKLWLLDRLFIIMLHQRLASPIIRRGCRSHQRTAVFPGASMGAMLPLIFRRDRHMILHVMGILMLIEIHPVLSAQRIFYGIANEQKRKMKLLLFSVFSLGIRPQRIPLHAKGDRHIRSMEVEPLVQLRIKCPDLRGQNRNFFL